LPDAYEKKTSRRTRIGHNTDIGLAGCPTPQRIATYSLSPNRQRPFAGAGHAAIFNVFRRFRHQVLYVVPPFVIAYAAMNWAIER
jgi:ubiquinol-cytochrome c reductase subunit 8